MSSYRRIVLLLMLAPILLAPGSVALSQEAPAGDQRVESDGEILGEAEEDIRLLNSKNFVRNRVDLARRTERRLMEILRLDPNTPLRARVEENLFQVREILANHNLLVAHFYVDRASATGAAKGAKARLLAITREFPEFSRMDEVLFFLGEVSQMDDRAEDAADYFWKIICRYPASGRVGDAFGRLNAMGFDASKGCDKLKP